MDKLEYDSLHKFLVSLGVIFIALPFVVLYFVFSNREPFKCSEHRLNVYIEQGLIMKH